MRSKPTSTTSNGVGVLLGPWRLPPRAPAAPRLLHLLQVSITNLACFSITASFSFSLADSVLSFDSRLWHGTVCTRANHRVVAAARPAGAVRRMLGSARARYCVRVQSTSDRPCPSFECPQTKSYTPVPAFPHTAAKIPC